MNQDSLRQLLADGLPALKAGGRIAAESADEIKSSASDSELKSLLETGNEKSREWQARIDRAMDEVGSSGEGENPIMRAHYDVSKQIREAAPDDQVRDLGIIASGQLVLHYWIAAFGTMAAYAKQLGLEQTKQEMGSSVEEAKQADEQHTRLAERIMS